jgi:shikimate dehydrogenase
MSRFAVIGDPVLHSKSPLMHVAAYRALGLAHTYEAIRATAAELPAIVDRLRQGDLGGVNVTVPHKVRILGLVDEVASSAASVGASNTLVRDEGGRITAHNTDVPALAAEISAFNIPHADLQSRAAIVLGTGGAGRAAVAALRDLLGVSRVIVRGRHAPLPLEGDADVDKDVGIVIQATSCGMTGADSGDVVARAVAWDALPPSAIAIDVVYAPPETPFLAAARARGLRHANGLGMLARQGALAFELWLGVPAPLAAMRSALGSTPEAQSP